VRRRSGTAYRVRAAALQGAGAAAPGWRRAYGAGRGAAYRRRGRRPLTLAGLGVNPGAALVPGARRAGSLAGMPRPTPPTVRQLAPLRPPGPRRRPPRGEPGWTFAVTALALFMFALDRLIVASALPVIRDDLGAGLQALEWTVNAFTLTFAVLLLAGAALGDRFGRRRMFIAGVVVFTAGSAAAALAPSAGALVAARALQGVGGSLIVPLSLTLVTAATPPERRGAVLGAWAAVAGVAAASGPVLGGALAEALSWQWIFWINVPIGVALIPLAHRRLAESRGPAARLDGPGLVLSGAGLLAIVWALVEAGAAGWGDQRVLAALAAGATALAGFVAWERRAPAPMLPLALFRSRPFAAASAVALLAYLGLFGGLFLIGQLLQTGLGATPLEAGLGLVAMSGAMVVAAPVAGVVCDRLGPRPLVTGALGLVALGLGWLAAEAEPGVAYLRLAPGLVMVGLGAACLFAPLQATQLGAAAPAHQGQAAGAATAVRELGGVLGVAVLAAVFAAHGSAASPAAFLAGFRPALLAGAAVVTCALLAARALPGPARRRAIEPAPAPAG